MEPSSIRRVDATPHEPVRRWPAFAAAPCLGLAMLLLLPLGNQALSWQATELNVCAIGAGLLAGLAIVAVHDGAREARACANVEIQTACMFAWEAAALGARAVVSPEDPATSFVLFMSVSGLSAQSVGYVAALVSRRSSPNSPSAGRAATAVPLCTLGFVVGAAVEECWHGQGLDSLEPAFVPALLSICLAIAAKALFRKRARAWVQILPSLMACTVLFLTVGPVVACVVALMLLLPGNIPPNASGARNMFAATTGFSLGLLATNYLVNGVDYVFPRMESALRPASTTLFVCLMLALLLISLASLATLEARLRSSSATGAEQRLHRLAAAHGLSKLQEEILVRACDNQSVETIARDLSYAPSTIRSERQKALTQLGLTDARELAELMELR